MAEFTTRVFVPPRVDLDAADGDVLGDFVRRHVGKDRLYKRPDWRLRRLGEGHWHLMFGTEADKRSLKDRLPEDGSCINLDSLLPGHELDELRSRPYQFSVVGVRYELFAPPIVHAYDRRRLVLKRSEIGAVAPHRDHETRDELNASEQLYVDSLDIDFPKEPQGVTQWPTLYEGSQCLILPPVRKKFEPESYYRADLVRCRAHLRRAHVGDLAPERQPLAVWLWSVLDDPILRDLIAEGAVLSPCTPITEAGGSALGVALQKSADSRTDVGAFRTMFLENSVGSAAQLRLLCDRIREDVMEAARLVRVDLRSVDGSGLDDRRPDPVPGSGNYHPPDGSWSWFAAVAGQSDAEDLRPLRVDVIAAAQMPSLGGPAHDAAERAFLSALFRCPWSKSLDPGPWRRTMLWIIKAWAAKEAPWPDIDAPDSEEWPRIVEHDGRLEFHHLVSMSEVERGLVLLRLPLSARVVAGGVVWLDDSYTVLDSGFMLGSEESHGGIE